MQDTVDPYTGLLNSQIQDMSFGQPFNPGQKWEQIYPIVAETLSACTERDQDIFGLIFNDNIPYRTIAKQHQISAARVGQIKNRIIHNIKRKIIESKDEI
jgi:DNA-directed RNA polymerase specialized sigma subunit